MAIDYYQILGINTESTLDQIKQAYRKKAKLYHPDVNAEPDAHEKFILINEAYEYFINKQTNRTYKRQTHETQSNYNDTWIKNERARARQRAEKHAKMKFDEFRKSKIYRSALVASLIFDLVYLAIFTSIIILPFAYTLTNGIDLEHPFSYITGFIAIESIGFVFLYILFADRLKKGFFRPKSI